MRIKMKQCSTCREEFANKFSFCPVDGTPLIEPSDAPIDQPPLHQTEQTVSSLSASADSYAANASEDVPATAASSTALIPANEYHLTFVDDTGLTRRLMGELRDVAHHSELTWPEFKRDPFGYSKRFLTGYSSLIWRFFSSRNVAIATSASLLLVLSAIIAFVVVGKANAN